MPSFTAQAASGTNTVATALVSIAISPEDSILTSPALLPGQSVTGTPIQVSNVGDVNCLYFVSADWKAAGSTTASMATVLANVLNVSVVVSPNTALYTGALSGLKDQPTGGHALNLGADPEVVQITVALPSDTGNIVMNQDLSVDFIFVATQA